MRPSLLGHPAFAGDGMRQRDCRLGEHGVALDAGEVLQGVPYDLCLANHVRCDIESVESSVVPQEV